MRCTITPAHWRRRIPGVQRGQRPRLHGCGARRAITLAAAAALAGLATARRAAAQTDIWLGGVGNWNDPTQWSIGIVPNDPALSVAIDNGNAALSVVTLDISPTIASLTIDSGDSLLWGNSSIGLALTGSGTINGTLNLAGGTNAFSNTALGFQGPGPHALSGAGSLVLGTSSTIQNLGVTGALTFSGGLLIHGGDNATINGGSGGIINQATIAADVSNKFLTVANITNLAQLQAVNGGTLVTTNLFNASGAFVQVFNSTLTLNGTWHNGGIIVDNNGTVNLGGTFQVSDLGNINRSGGVVNLTGTLNNTGTLSLNAATGSLILEGGTINGGAVTSSGGALLQIDIGTLDGVTLKSAPAFLASNRYLFINHDLVLGPGVIFDLSAGTNGFQQNTLVFQGTSAQTLGGVGQVTLGTGFSNSVANQAGTNLLTIGPGILVHGGGLSGAAIYGNAGGILNQGTIAADLPGGILSLNNATNVGQLQAVNGATLITNNLFNAPGAVAQVINGSTLTLNGLWHNAGQIIANNGTVNLGGTFVFGDLGAFSRTGGLVNLTGTLNNVGKALGLTATTGSWVMEGGTISGGSVSTGGGALLQIDVGTLDGVTLDSSPAFFNNSRVLYVQNGLTLGPGVVIDLGAGTNNFQANSLAFSGTTAQTLGGVGQVIFGAGSNNNIGNNAGTLLTIGPGILVHGGLNAAMFGNSGGILNQGTIAADVSGGFLTLNNATNAAQLQAINGGALFTNNLVNGPSGVAQINGGSTLTLNGLWHNAGVIALNNGTVNLGGNFTPADIGTLSRISPSTVNITGTLSNPGNFVLNAATGSFTLIGGTIAGGTISSAGAAQLLVNYGTLDAVTLATSPQFIYANGYLTINNGLSLGPGVGIDLAGGTNNFAIPMTFSGGNHTLSLLSGNSSIGGGIIAQAGTNSLVIDVPTGSELTIGSALNPAALSLVKTGGGTLVLTSTDTVSHNYAGGISLNGGSIRISSDLNLGANAGNSNSVSFAGGILEIAGDVNFSSNRTFTLTPGAIGGFTVTGSSTLTIDESNQLRALGAGGILAINGGPAAKVVIAASNDISAQVTVGSGTLELRNPAALGAPGQKAPITLAGGQLNLRDSSGAVANFGNDVSVPASSSINVADLSGGGAAQVALGALNLGSAAAATLAVTGASGSTLQFGGPGTLAGFAAIDNSVQVLLAGPVGGAGSLTKTGPGTLTLLGSAANSYTGPTTIQSGTLELAKTVGVTALPGDLMLQGGAAVLLAPNQIADGSSVHISGGLFDANGQSETVLSLDNQGGVFRTGAGVFTVTSSNSTTFAPGSTNTVNSGGTLNTSHLKISGGNNTVNASGLITNLSIGLDFLGNQSPSITLMPDAVAPGRILLGGDITFSGTDGTALIANGAGAGNPGQLDLGGSARTISLNRGLQPCDMVITAQIVNGTLIKAGPGILRLAGTNSSFAGGLSIQQAVVEAASPTALGAGAITFAGAGAELHLRMDAAPAVPISNTLGAAPADSITIDVQPAAGTATSAFTFTGITLGTALNVTGTAGEKLVFTGSTLQNSVNIFNTIDVSLNGAMSGPYAIAKDNGGTLTFGGTVPNSYSGGTTVYNGMMALSKTSSITAVPGDLSIYGPAVVQLTSSDQIAHAANVTLIPTATSPALDLNGQSATISCLSGSGTLSLGVGGSLTVLRSGTSGVSTFSGTITGSAASLIADGATGNLTLSGHNTYTGTTTINAGVLNVSADDNLGAPSAALAINNGSLLATTTFSSARPIILSHANSTIDISGATNTLTLTGPFSGGGGLTKGPLGGSLLLATSGTISPASLTVSGGTLNASSLTTLNVAGALSIAANANVNFLPSGTNATGRLTHQANSLVLAGAGPTLANLDLGNHELLLGPGANPATIKTYLQSAYDPSGNADWAQRGLTSSLAKSNPTSYSVGYAYGGDQSAQDAAVTTHGGASLGMTQTLVRPVLTGDANLDGIVDFFDITQILGYKYNTSQTASYTDGDLDYSGKVDFFDIVLLLSANYNTGQMFGPSRAAPALASPARVAAPTGVIAAATTIGTTGDGKPDFEYDPATGHLRFRADGGAFTTTGGASSFVSSLTISSAGGILLPGGASNPFATGTGATLTSTLLSSALTSSPGFSDGFDIGLVLAPGLDAATLTADLTVKYQSLNGGSLKTADVTFIPEPAGLAIAGLGAAGLLARRRRRQRSR
jgi:autotransporter-associated beta strand protein